MIEGRKVMSARRGILRLKRAGEENARTEDERGDGSVCLFDFIGRFVVVNPADVFDTGLLLEIRPRSK